MLLEYVLVKAYSNLLEYVLVKAYSNLTMVSKESIVT